MLKKGELVRIGKRRFCIQDRGEYSQVPSAPLIHPLTSLIQRESGRDQPSIPLPRDIESVSVLLAPQAVFNARKQVSAAPEAAIARIIQDSLAGRRLPYKFWCAKVTV
jgi:hypothetical protein